MTNSTPRVGWIGTGVMGAYMAQHLLGARYPMTVSTRSRNKAAGLEKNGATWAETPAEVAAASDIVFSMVGYPSDVRDVFLGEDGVLSGVRHGSIVVDMTTSEPSLAEEISVAARRVGVEAVDAPVSGGDIGARNATLSIMVGGEGEAVGRVWPLFETMGNTIVHLGGPGAGQHTKMVNQILIAGGMVSLAEALLYAQKAGLDFDRMLEAVSGGAAGSWSLTNYGHRMLAGDFAPGFFVDHFVKDMEIALREANAMAVSTPGLALAHQLYVSVQAQGGGKKGTQALLLALARLADIQWAGEASSG